MTDYRISLNSLLFAITISFPLHIRNFLIKGLNFLSGSKLPSAAFCKIFRGRYLFGILPDGNVLCFPLDDLKILEIISEIYFDKIYDASSMGYFKNILDIGSHIGLFTLRASKLASKSRITSIEANPLNFNLLRRNMAVNHLFDRVRILNFAAGEQRGKASLSIGELSRGDSSIKLKSKNNLNSMIVEVFPIDELLFADDEWDMIKLDVEGAEVEVLKGLKRTLSKTRLIDMELHSLLVNDLDVYSLLRDSEFKIVKNRKLYEWCSFIEAERA